MVVYLLVVVVALNATAWLLSELLRTPVADANGHCPSWFVEDEDE
jgi:hypothetical protein